MSNVKLRVQARANRLGILPEELRLEAVARLRESVSDGDAAFIKDDEMFSLFSHEEKLELFSFIKDDVVSSLEGVIERIEDAADVDEDPAAVFYDLGETLDLFESLFAEDREVVEAIKEGRSWMEWAVERLEERRSESDSNPYDEIQAPARSEGGSHRSIFDDVDE